MYLYEKAINEPIAEIINIEKDENGNDIYVCQFDTQINGDVIQRFSHTNAEYFSMNGYEVKEDKIRIDLNNNSDIKWLDEVSFVCEVYGDDYLTRLFPMYANEEEEIRLDCEYHKDDNTCHYILILEDETISVTNLINTEYMNKELIELSKR